MGGLPIGSRNRSGASFRSAARFSPESAPRTNFAPARSSRRRRPQEERKTGATSRFELCNKLMDSRKATTEARSNPPHKQQHVGHQLLAASCTSRKVVH